MKNAIKMFKVQHTTQINATRWTDQINRQQSQIYQQLKQQHTFFEIHNKIQKFRSDFALQKSH